MALILCILDGWGCGIDDASNAISVAETPNWSYILDNFPNTTLNADGHSVGLPNGQFGNSEVGHTTIGAGRILPQPLSVVTSGLAQIPNNSAFIDFAEKIHRSSGIVHLLALISDGGVHSHLDHVVFLIDFFDKNKISYKVHAFLDGRDTNPKSALRFIGKISNVATISGRYYAMDRDQRLDRTKLAFCNIISGNAKKFASPQEAINHFYGKDISDEFIPPSTIGDYQGIKNQDGFMICNFRQDRVVQLLDMINQNTDNQILGMVNYGERFRDIPCIFPHQVPLNTLGKVLEKQGLKQLRIAETEKYAHVTFFFNGRTNNNFQNQRNILIPSKKVATYDLYPEMSALEITNTLISQFTKFDFILINYANADMVGHTGSFDATVKCVEFLDKCLGRILQGLPNGDIMIITADHGNADIMFDRNGINTSHTINPVPFVLIESTKKRMLKTTGSLTDVAPTVLDILSIKKPSEMTGSSLLKKN